jgi:hypothetical protein
MDPVMVYNPLGWERSDVVKLEIKAGGQYKVFTKDGKEIASQAAKSEDRGDYLYFAPDSIPALGWKIFYLNWYILTIEFKRQFFSKSLPNIIRNYNHFYHNNKRL